MRSFQPNKFTYTSPVRLFVTNIFSTPYPRKVVFVTLRWLPKFLNFTVDDLLRFGTRNFCFANNRGTFRKTMKTAMKGAKMLAILNSKMLPEVWHVRAQILANSSFRVAVPYPVNISPNTALYFSQILDEGNTVQDPVWILPPKQALSNTKEKLPAWQSGLPSFVMVTFSAPWFTVTE